MTNSEYYDLIPDRVFSDGGSILELGSGDGSSQLGSRHADRFRRDYLGIDFRDDLTPLLNVVQENFLDFETSERYDLVLAIAVLEHIPLSCWPLLFEKMSQWVKSGGHVVVLVPHDEQLRSYVTSEDYNFCKKNYPVIGYGGPCHVVHGITPKVLRHFLPAACVSEVRHHIVFRDPQESLVRASARFVKRLLTGHRFVWRGLRRKKHLLVAIWRKSEEVAE